MMALKERKMLSKNIIQVAIYSNNRHVHFSEETKTENLYAAYLLK